MKVKSIVLLLTCLSTLTALGVFIGAASMARERVLLTANSPDGKWMVKIVARPQFGYMGIGWKSVDVFSVVTDSLSQSSWEKKLHNEDLLSDAEGDYNEISWDGTSWTVSPGPYSIPVQISTTKK